MAAGLSHRHRPSVGRGLAALAVAGLLVATAGTASQASSSRRAGSFAVTVTVGSPSETSVKLSKSSGLPAGSIVFTVRNAGTAKHIFKVCTKPEKTLANTCTGKSVTLSKHGQSAKLTLALESGKYEFLSTVSGQSVAGKKGTIGVGVKASTATQTIPAGGSSGSTTTGKSGTGGSPTGTTTTTTSGSGSQLPTFPAGNAQDGATVFQQADCGSCHTLSGAPGAVGGGGPDLDQLMPSVADVEMQVYLGGGGMPPFEGELTNQQIADVAAYVSQTAQQDNAG